jgi:hypothetical protein
MFVSVRTFQAKCNTESKEFYCKYLLWKCGKCCRMEVIAVGRNVTHRKIWKRLNINKWLLPGPPLWSSGQSCWLQIRRPGFDSRHYQKKKAVGLERGPLSLVSTTEELLDINVAAPVYKTENTAVGIRHADHVAPFIRKSWQSLRRQAAVALSV